MKIIIIEDEKLTADDLAATIKKLRPETSIIAWLNSVAKAKLYFSETVTDADLIFSDIQLGDGTAFDIFKESKATIPVIFCTAYDEYALDAFEANGVNYILKPFTDHMIAEALSKYDLLREKMLTGKPLPHADFSGLHVSKEANSLNAILLHDRDKIVRVLHEDIAFICFRNGAANIITTDKKSYWINKSMEECEKELGSLFYRLNRQYLVHKNAIHEVSATQNRKLSVSLIGPEDEPVFVSKEKKSEFLNWLRE